MKTRGSSPDLPGRRTIDPVPYDSTVSPALPRTRCASIERLIFEEQTTPKERIDGVTGLDVAGGKPGGVDGRFDRER